MAKKQFKIGNYSCYDTSTITDGKEEYSIVEIVDLLNELNDENIKLKREIASLQKQ